MKKRLLLLSFVEGACVMAAELCGAKLLAPIYGSSLYVWASVMGITLGALALGYYYGGYLSGKTGDRVKRLFRILNAAALFILAMPLLSYYLVPRISYLPFLPGVILNTILILFPAVFLLGASSPLFIDIQTSSTQTAGRVSGTIYAVSTVGGIISTFFCGFFSIPEFGLNLSLILFSVLLFAMNSLVLKLFRSAHLLILIGFAYLNYQFLSVDTRTLYVSDGLLGRVKVEDDQINHVRLLSVNDIVQSEMNLDSKRSVSPYVALLDTLIKPAGLNRNALVLGLGGGLTANLLSQKHYDVEGVELDERIGKIAQKYFFLEAGIKNHCEDARYFLNHTAKKYSIVLVDVFKGEEQPSHILTSESLKALKSQLSDSGLILINWHGYSEGPKSEGTAVLYNTIREAGYFTRLYSHSADQDHRNILLVASVHQLPSMSNEIAADFPSTPLNTDDQPLLEKYNARANKSWRSSYLRYYQSR